MLKYTFCLTQLIQLNTDGYIYLSNKEYAQDS